MYACLFEAVCDVTTVPSHLNPTQSPLIMPVAMEHSVQLKCVEGSEEN